MILRTEEQAAFSESRFLIEKTGIPFTRQELDSMVSADFGLSRLRKEGIQVLTFLNTEKVGAKIIVLLPGQTMLEHWHPKRGVDSGKEETLRCIFGICRLYIPGEESIKLGSIPQDMDNYYTCRKEINLQINDQYTISPGIPHWFQPGKEGCVIFSFSNNVTDLEDKFTNPHVVRNTVYADSQP